MDVRVLGSLEVVVDGGSPVVLGGAKQRSVLAMLALQANTLLSVDVLAEGVWGERVPGRYVQNLQVYVSTLRRLVEPSRTTAMPSRILARGNGYELILGPDELDLSRFRGHVNEGVRALETARPSKSASALRLAMAQWRGEPCADLMFQPFATTMTRGLLEERWSAFERLMEAELAAGRGAELVAELEVAVDLEPMRETLWEQLATALYRAGRQGDALAACRRARERLVDELGLDPGPRLRLVEQQVLEQAPSLDAPRGATIRASRVPVPLNSLVGRDELVDMVTSTVTLARLVVLAGPGGVGKTRVALAVAAGAIGRPVVFVDLSSERDPLRVLAAIASAVETSDRIGDVAERLEADETLLVIDNFEQVIEASDVVASIVALAPSCRVLVTSRTRLEINGEKVIEVPPLSTDGAGLGASAMRLFCERALDVHPSLDVNAFHAEIATVCRDLDGMPLALELAASRLGVLSPTDLARGIDAALRGGSSGTGSQRHGSMRSTIEWSTDLLNWNEGQLFAALAVCEAAVDIDTVRALGVGCAMTEIETDQALEGLVRASLVRVSETDDGRRFSYLATIRAFARSSLDAATEERMRAVHADWFFERVVAHSTGDVQYSATELATSTADLPDTTAAVRWLADHGSVDRAALAVASRYTTALVEGGHYSVMRSLTEHILSRADLSRANRARMKVIAGGMSYLMSDPKTAQSQLVAVDDLAEDDYAFRARGSMWRAVLCADAGAHPDAAAFAESARTAAQCSGLRRLVGLAWSASSYVAIAAGDAEHALECAQQELEVELPGSFSFAMGLVEVAFALLELNRVDEALEQARQALIEARRTGIAQPRGEAYRCLARCALLLGDTSTAALCLLEQLDVFDHPDSMIDRVIEVVLAAALCLGSVGRGDDARELWAQGVQLLDHHATSMKIFPAYLLAIAVELDFDGAMTSATPVLASTLSRVREQLAEIGATTAAGKASVETSCLE